MLASAFHTVLNGWDVVVGLLAVVAVIVLDKLVPAIPWLGWASLFAIVLFGCALTVRF